MKSSILSMLLVGASALNVPNIEFSGTGDLSKRSVPSGPEYNYPQQPNQRPTNYQRPANTNGFVPESEYRDALLRVHNDVRAAHGVPALTWSQDLVNYAMANSPSCEGYGHTRTLQQDAIGENILFGQSTPDQMVKELWYDKELRLYDFNRQGYSGATGHLTQMIWKATTEVGCMVRKCSFGTYVKCDYRKKGNISGQFEQNCNAPTSYQNKQNYQNNAQNYQNYQNSNQNYENYQSGNQNYQNYQNDQRYQNYQPANYNQNYQPYNYYVKRDGTDGDKYQQPTENKKDCDKKVAADKNTEAKPKTIPENEPTGYRRPVYSPLYEMEKGNAYDITNPNNFNMVPGRTFRNIDYGQSD
ncbi:hypothetical protein TWF718_009277 [Orbilia javanica]|uniref:SCP domain-containing protein n=1 Tax=Orbilia javanica TaxID=47235 RepID=A0AAN8MVK1_9PEZI